MSTIGFIKWIKQRGPHKSRAPSLEKCPQKRAIVIKSFETTPRKPNSARRRVAKVRFCNSWIKNVYLEGIGFNKLPAHSVILVRGRGPRDLPGVRYHAIRGLKDFPALITRCKGRSKYGTKQPQVEKKISVVNSWGAENYKLKYRLLQYQECIKNRRYATTPY